MTVPFTELDIRRVGSFISAIMSEADMTTAEQREEVEERSKVAPQVSTRRCNGTSYSRKVVGNVYGNTFIVDSGRGQHSAHPHIGHSIDRDC